MLGGGQGLVSQMSASMHSEFRLARNAMATRFEIVAYGQDSVRLRSAAEEAFAEVEAVEARLNLYSQTSEIARLNAMAAREPVRVSSELYRLLEQARDLNLRTSGAFDVTVAPLVRAWGFMGSSGHQPDPDALETARSCVGMDGVLLDPSSQTVRFRKSGMMLDFGAIGKGYALDVAVRSLRDAGIESALIHGGTSSVYGLGLGPDREPWKIAIEKPERVEGDSKGLLAIAQLENSSLSVSAVWGKSFQSGGRRLGHILDPRSGNPVEHTWLAAVSSPSATESDALSTALLTLGREGLEVVESMFPGLRTLVVSAPCENLASSVVIHGFDPGP